MALRSLRTDAIDCPAVSKCHTSCLGLFHDPCSMCALKRVGCQPFILFVCWWIWNRHPVSCWLASFTICISWMSEVNISVFLPVECNKSAFVNTNITGQNCLVISRQFFTHTYPTIIFVSFFAHSIPFRPTHSEASSWRSLAGPHRTQGIDRSHRP